MYKILILGGTAEAAALAEALEGADNFLPVTSLAGRTRKPRRLAGKTRTGGFGGADGLAAYIKKNDIAALVDATHPHAAQITEHAASAAAQCGIPLARLGRAPWREEKGDRWTTVASVDAAAGALPQGVRAFVTTGRQRLEPFLTRDDLWCLIRVVEMPVPSPDSARAKFLSARGPFAVEDETALMKEHRIDWLVSKNSGGTSSYAKIEAARALGLPVMMVAPPDTACVGGDNCETVAAVCDWLGEVFA
jgi:precorrin-6A/cobalt-precorrin-6A reductase